MPKSSSYINSLVWTSRAANGSSLFRHNINEALLLGDRVIVLSPLVRNIKREFVIDMPRPRNSDAPELQIIKRKILKEFEEDFRHAK